MEKTIKALICTQTDSKIRQILNIYEKRATLRATLFIIKQTNHLIMGENPIKILHVLSHVCTILHVLSSSRIRV